MLALLCKILCNTIGLLIGVAYLTLAERKVMASMQRRKGPNVTGAYGILQPLADGLKLLVKEPVMPHDADSFLFLLAPVLTFLLSQLFWCVVPFGEGIVFADVNIGVLYMFAVSSLGVYGIILSGWSSHSIYALLGSLRSAAQMISYEVSIGLLVICVILCAGSMNLTDIVLAQKGIWYCVPLFPVFVLFFISIVAETNRAPFDLPEAEAELVAGYNVEYSSMGFALFFLGEYANMIVMSAFISLLFCGGWLPPINSSLFYMIPGVFWLGIKIIFFLFLFVWVRASYPRYRYDQLMQLGWKVILPLSIGWLVFVSGVLISFL